MPDLTKKTILISLGALSLIREKTRKLAKDLAKRGEMTKTNETKLIKNLIELTEKNKARIEKKAKKIVEKTLTRLDIPTREEINTLRAEINKFSKK